MGFLCPIICYHGALVGIWHSVRGYQTITAPYAWNFLLTFLSTDMAQPVLVTARRLKCADP